MLDKAESIDECPNVETIWNNGPVPANETMSWSDLILSRSESGPYLHIMCPEGSHVVGPTVITCLKGGVWNDETIPSCSSSSLYGIPESDMVLIGVLAACGTIVVITLTIILAHLLCFRNRLHSTSSSVERLDRLSGNYPQTSLYGEDVIYSISGPKQTASSGAPFNPANDTGYLSAHISNSFHDNASLSNFSLPRYYLQSTVEPYYVGHIADSGSGCSPYDIAHVRSVRNSSEVGVANGGFRDEFPCNYDHNWADNELRVLGSDESTEHLPSYSTLDRTML